jgi:hypothetical protein
VLENKFIIDFERSGGFTGIPVRVILSNQLLSQDELDEIQRLIESSDFLRLKSEGRSARSLPDQFMYRITVETSNYRHSIAVYEQEVTTGLRPLILFLSEKARSKK